MFQCDCPPDNCAGKVQRYLKGERGAGDELVSKFQALVRSIVQRVLGPSRREEWDDACQAVFLRLFTNLERWEQRCPFCKWLAVVAARRAIDLSRAPVMTENVPTFDHFADQRKDLPDHETIERIEQVVSRFSTEWRQVWEMWREGLKREEMAQRTGRSVRTIQYWLAEMMDQLRECLGD